MLVTYNPVILAGKYDTPADKTEARRQDLDYLSRLTKYDRSFDAAEAAAFQSNVDTLSARADTMSDAAHFLGVAAAVALADNGHTNISYHPLWAEFDSVDLRLGWFEDGLYVVQSSIGTAALLGQRVTHIDGRTVRELVEGLKPYRGGNAGWRKNIVPSFAVVPSVLYAAGLSEADDGLTLRVETAESEVSEHLLVATQSAERSQDRMSLSLDMPDARALSLAPRTGAVQGALPGGGHYIRMPAGFSSSENPHKIFYGKTLEAITPSSLDHLVIDFRRNSGGNYGHAVEFAQRAHTVVEPNGTIYLATSSDTFSAAIVTIAMIKHYSEREVVIIGTPMGDREAFWAERGMSFRLPNSGWTVNYATGFHDWGGDCAAQAHCFTRNRRYDDVAVGSMAPDIHVGQRYADFINRRDPLLEEVQRVQSSR